MSLTLTAFYHRGNLDDRDRNYYRRVHLGCVRASDFLAQWPKFDGHNLLVTGGSQGGQRSIVTASLNRRVTGLAATYPAYCDVTGDLHGQAGGRPHMFRIDRCANREDEAANEWLLTAFKLMRVRTNTEPDRWKPTFGHFQQRGEPPRQGRTTFNLHRSRPRKNLSRGNSPLMPTRPDQFPRPNQVVFV